MPMNVVALAADNLTSLRKVGVVYVGVSVWIGLPLFV